MISASLSSQSPHNAYHQCNVQATIDYVAMTDKGAVFDSSVDDQSKTYDVRIGTSEVCHIEVLSCNSARMCSPSCQVYPTSWRSLLDGCACHVHAAICHADASDLPDLYIFLKACCVIWHCLHCMLVGMTKSLCDSLPTLCLPVTSKDLAICVPHISAYCRVAMHKH